MKAEALACQTAGMVRVKETTFKIETGEGTLKELKTQIEVSRESRAEVKEALGSAEALDAMAAGGFDVQNSDLAVDIDTRTRATVAHEKDG